MLSLYSEIIVSILGASLLGLFAGWMIQKSLNKGKLAGTVALWEDRLKAAEDDARRDSEHLEDHRPKLKNACNASFKRKIRKSVYYAAQWKMDSRTTLLVESRHH